MKVRFTRAANVDLETIGDYISRDDWRRAVSFVEELRVACAELTTSPTLYPLVNGYEDQALRRRLYGRYLIFFRVVDAEIRILRVLHGARDIRAILDDD